MCLEMVNQDHFQGEFVSTIESVFYTYLVVEKSENRFYSQDSVLTPN